MRGVFNASKYPNIAVTKLAAMHGCETYQDFDMFTPKLSKAYISAIFSWEGEFANHINDELCWRGTEVELGGPGLSTEIRRDIEDYPLEGFSHSYTSTGCIRDCPWCIVPRMWDGVRELDEWGYAPKMIDPNILATSDEHKIRITKKLAGRRVEWNGGLDTRLVDKSNARFIANTSTSTMFLSWDSGDDEEPLAKALENLRAVGVNPLNQVKVYILTGYEGGWESGYQRAVRVKGLGATPFIMRYQPLFGVRITYPKIYNDLAYWCNSRVGVLGFDFADFDPKIRNRMRKNISGRSDQLPLPEERG